MTNQPDQTNTTVTLTAETIYPTLRKEFEKIAYLKSRMLDAADFEQEMWLVLYEFIDERGMDGKTRAGKVLLAQRPQYIAIFCAGRARKHIHRGGKRLRYEVDTEAAPDIVTAVTPDAEQEEEEDVEQAHEAALIDLNDEAALIRRAVRLSGGRVSFQAVRDLIDQLSRRIAEASRVPANEESQRRAAYLFLKTGNVREAERLGANRRAAYRFRQALIGLASL